MQIPNEEATLVRETYLRDVTKQIQDRLSPLEAYESIHEIRDHLDSIAAAYEEVGMEPVAAMHAAITKFGQASQVGTGLAGASNGFLTPRVGQPIAFLAYVAGVGLLGFGLMVAIDFTFFLAGWTSTMWVPGDLGAGGVTGCIVGTLAWVTRRRARCFAWTMVGLLNLVIAATMLQTFLTLNDVGFTAKLLGSLSAGMFCLAFVAAKSAAFVRRSTVRPQTNRMTPS